MQVADQPAPVDLAHDVLTESNEVRLARLVEHGEEDAGDELQHQHQQRQRAEEVPDVEVLRRVVAGELGVDELIDRQALVEPGPEASFLRCRARRQRPPGPRSSEPRSVVAIRYLPWQARWQASRIGSFGRLPNRRGSAALYTARGGHMLERLSRGLTFIAGSVVGGLALAFVIVAVRPDLIRGNAARSRRPQSAPVVAESAPRRARARALLLCGGGAARSPRRSQHIHGPPGHRAHRSVAARRALRQRPAAIQAAHRAQPRLRRHRR